MLAGTFVAFYIMMWDILYQKLYVNLYIYIVPCFFFII